jgi:uncharacterized protein YndB with AHSA1/START domain
MRFVRSLVIHRPREVVWRAFADVALERWWRPGLHAAERVSGAPGEPGAIRRLVLRAAGRDLTVIETVTLRRAPESLGRSYASPALGGTRLDHFAALHDGRTRWTIDCELHARGSWRALAGIVRVAAEWRVAAGMRRLRRAMERGAPAE